MVCRLWVVARCEWGSCLICDISAVEFNIHRLAYRAGVIAAISAPVSSNFLYGLGVAFSTGARHKLERGAVIRPVTALHVRIGPGQGTSVSTQIATLRKLLIGGEKHGAFRRVAHVSAVFRKIRVER